MHIDYEYLVKDDGCYFFIVYANIVIKNGKRNSHSTTQNSFLRPESLN